METIPEIGKYYHFWDDGKSSPSRHYVCKCERVITPDEAKNIMVSVPYDDDLTIETTLYDHWLESEMPEHDWLYAKETDYFVECSCPKYDENNLWFVRTRDGGWFSMNIQNWWQGGTLDVDEKILDGIIENIKKYPEWYPNQEEWIKKYKEKKY